jgi:hypothetical protein
MLFMLVLVAGVPLAVVDVDADGLNICIFPNSPCTTSKVGLLGFINGVFVFDAVLENGDKVNAEPTANRCMLPMVGEAA